MSDHKERIVEGPLGFVGVSTLLPGSPSIRVALNVADGDGATYQIMSTSRSGDDLTLNGKPATPGQILTWIADPASERLKDYGVRLTIIDGLYVPVRKAEFYDIVEGT